MNTAKPKHFSDSSTQVYQDHVATEVLLILATNNHQNLLEKAVEQTTRAALRRQQSDRSLPPVRLVLDTSPGLEHRITQHPLETHRVTWDPQPEHLSKTWRFPQTSPYTGQAGIAHRLDQSEPGNSTLARSPEPKHNKGQHRSDRWGTLVRPVKAWVHGMNNEP
jgi:hypothetical protein